MLTLTTQLGLTARPLSTDEIDEALVDSDGDGLFELVDTLENPLRFYNAPTRLVRPDGFVGTNLANISTADAALARSVINSLPTFEAGAYPGQELPPSLVVSGANTIVTTTHPLNIDPFDRLRLLDTTFATDLAVAGYFGATGTVTIKAFTEEWYWTPNTFLVPVVLAAGADELFGMDPPSSNRGIDATGDVVAATGTSGFFTGNGAARLGYIAPEDAGFGDASNVSDNLSNRKRVLQ